MRGRDLIGTPPDELLQHVLSFLPSRDAVQSSLLSRRWRDLWKSAPAVRVSGRGDDFRRFVDSLLSHRNEAAQLRSFEIDDLVIGLPNYAITTYDDYDDDDDYEDGQDEDRHLPDMNIDPSVDRWIMYALSTCRATSLTARFDEDIGVLWRPRDPNAFASKHLTTMHLEIVELADSLLDFSPFPALQDLTLDRCCLNGDALVSPSLQRLTIIHCDTPIGRYTAGGTTTVRISTPSLRHLHFYDSYDGDQTVVSLDRMPRLTTASIRLTGSTRMYPGNSRDGCLLLQGLSEATTLELNLNHFYGTEILRSDLTWCPTFTKLKTLTLNMCCVHKDVAMLACLLRHTPPLEKLILPLDFESRHDAHDKTEGNYTTSQQLLPTLENLKTVQIGHWPDSDTRVHEISKLFSDWATVSTYRLAISEAIW